MEPFSLKCSSCGSRIKVRKASAVGRVLPCPKCQQPIKIVAPTGERPGANPKSPPPAAARSKSKPAPGSHAAASTTSSDQVHQDEVQEVSSTSSSLLDDLDFSEVDSLLEQFTGDAEAIHVATDADRQAREEAAADDGSRETGSGQSTIDAADAPEDVTRSSEATAAEPASDAEHGSDTPHHRRPALPSDEWVSEATQSRRKLLLTLSLSIAGLLLAGLLILYLAYEMTRSDPNQVAQQEQGEGTKEAGTSNKTAPAGDSSVAGDQAATGNTRGNAIAGDMADSSPAANAADQASGTDPPPAEAGSGNDTPLPDDLDAGARTDPTLPGGIVSDEIERSNKADQETDVDSSSGSNDGDDAEDVAAPPGFNRRRSSEEVAGALNTPILSGLDEFDEFVDDSGLGDARAAAAAQRRLDSWALADAAAPYVEPPRPQELDLDRQLSQPVLGWEQKGGTLGEFLELMSQLVGAPVGLSANVITEAGLGSGTTLDVTASESTLAEVLAANLAKLDLTYEVLEHSVRVQPVGSSGAWIDRRYPLPRVLTESAGGADELTALLQTLVEPNSWELHGGQGKLLRQGEELVVTQTPGGHRGVARFLELLGAIRSGSAPPSDDPAAALRPYGQAEACLAEPLQIEIYQPTRLGEVVRRLNREAKIQTIVDWESLADAGWTYETELPLVIESGSVEGALRRLAASLQVDYRVLGPREFELLSRPVAARAQQVAFHDLSPILAAGIDINQLAIQVQTLFPQPADVPYEQFYYDAASRYLLARLAQRDQRALAKFLSAWQRTAAARVR